jgi:hypothetical protein
MDCSICGELIGKEASGWTEGHNAWPVKDGRCCGTCNGTEVLPARLEAMGYSRKTAKDIGEALRGKYTGEGAERVVESWKGEAIGN